MNIDYAESFNFKPKASITPLDGYWQNSTWKFNMPEITPDTAYAPSFVDVILHGNTALTLVNAKADSLEYLKLFGDTELLPETYIDSVTAEGAAELLPETYIDSVTAEGKCIQSNLPEGFTQVEYLQSSGTQYIDTGIVPDNDTGFSVTLQCINTPIDNFIYGARQGTDGRFVVGSNNGFLYFGYGIQTNSVSTSSWNDCAPTNKNNVKLNYKNSKIAQVNNSQDRNLTSTLPTFDNTTTVTLFGRNANGTVVGYAQRVYDNEITQGNNVIRNYIPARRNSDNVLGMYDTVSKQFLTNAGTGDFTAGPDVITPTPDTPMDIVCNNGVVKCNTNIFTTTGATLNKYIDANGQEQSGTYPGYSFAYTNYLKVKPNTTYTLSGVSKVSSLTNHWVSIWNSNKTFISRLVNLEFPANTVGNEYSVTFTTTAETEYIILNYVYTVDEEMKIYLNDYSFNGIYTEGTVETITDNVGNVATCERLLAIDTYKDTQEVLSGSVTRNIGIKVLDGTEDWEARTDVGLRHRYRLYTPNMLQNFSDTKNKIACTAFRCDYSITELNINSVDNAITGFYSDDKQYLFVYTSIFATDTDFKTWLADQYAQGTPVIIVYPINSTTSEAVAGQFLSKSPVTQTAGSISNLPIAITESSHTVPTPQQPLDIVCNNGVVKVTRNLIDLNAVTNGYYYDPQGVYSASSTSRLTDYIPIEAGQSVTTYFKSLYSTGNLNVRINIFNSNKVWQSQEVLQLEPSAGGVKIITPTANGYIRVSGNYSGSAIVDWNTAKVVYGEYTVATIDSAIGSIYIDGTQEVVTDSLGNTASAERLLAVGDYKDTQEVLSGSVTRNIGIKVLDGTEPYWALATATDLVQFYTPITQGVIKNDVSLMSTIAPYGCTVSTRTQYDFGCYSGTSGNLCFQMKGSATLTTVSAWTSFLSTQYQAGQPVVVVYPLATATTESITGQLLTKAPVTYSGSISGLTGTTVTSTHSVPTPQQPLDIVCNNGAIKVSKNLFNGQFDSGWGIGSITGAIVTAPTDRKAFYIKVEPTKTYTISRSAVGYSSYFWYGTYAQQPYSDQQQCVSYGFIGGSALTGTITVPTGANYLVFFFGTGTSPNVQVELGSTPTTYMPYGQIYVDGTTETVEITGKNLYNVATRTEGYFISAEGVITANSFGCYSELIPVKSNTYYTYSGRSSSGNKRLHAYDASGNWIQQINYVSVSSEVDFSVSGQTPANCKYVRISGLTTDTNIQLELGSTATTYEPYFDGGTATAQPLYKVGTYQDIQEVLEGDVTRNVGIKVLDGTETISRINNAVAPLGYYFALEDSDISHIAGDSNVKTPAYCTHFEDIVNSSPMLSNGKFTVAIATNRFYFGFAGATTAEGFAQFLANQYNSGNPVVIVYPLATPTTSTVTPQPMNIQAGTNIVQITQASMDELQLEVKYKAGVEVTIEEIETAQLDDNVEVTING